MTDTTAMHPVSTSLPDDLWECFDRDRRSQDRNVSQHLRWVLRRYYTMLDEEAKRSELPVVARPFASPQPHPGRSITVSPDQAVHTDARGVVVSPSHRTQ